MGVKLDEGGYKSGVPIDMTNILKKPEHAKGGRVGLDSGGNPLDKIKMNRRGFLGLMGSGIAAGVAGAKGWLTGGKSAVATAKAEAVLAAAAEKASTARVVGHPPEVVLFGDLIRG